MIYSYCLLYHYLISKAKQKIQNVQWKHSLRTILMDTTNQPPKDNDKNSEQGKEKFILYNNDKNNRKKKQGVAYVFIVCTSNNKVNL